MKFCELRVQSFEIALLPGHESVTEAQGEIGGMLKQGERIGESRRIGCAEKRLSRLEADLIPGESRRRMVVLAPKTTDSMSMTANCQR